MDIDIQEALEKSKKRLTKAKPNIKKRHEEGKKNSNEEPDELKSGYRNDLERRRVIKEQENDKFS